MKEGAYINKHIVIGILISTSLTLTFYSVNMIVFLDTTIFSLAIYMPIVVGFISGYVFGFLYNLWKGKQKALVASLEQQTILNEILLLSNQNQTLQEILDHAIQVIITAPFGKSQSKGAIFIRDANNHLSLKSHYKLSPALLKQCGTKGVDFGECLCGMAAKNKKTLFKTCVDGDHSIRFDNMDDHGHYNVPIIFNNDVLGVIAVYLAPQHKKNQLEIGFLESLANVLAIILNKMSVDKKSILNESILRDIQQFAGIGTWTLNIASSKIIASDEVYEIMGFRAQQFEYTEEDFLNVTHPDELNIVREALEQAKRGLPFEIETRHLKKDGSYAHIINKCKPKQLETGQVHELTGTIIDVTKLRLNEAELKEKQGLITGILSATPDPLFLLDLEINDITYHNKAMEEVFKTNPSFIPNFSQKGATVFREHVHPDDLEVYDEMNRALRSKKDSYSIVFRTNVFGNEYHWVDQKVLVYNRRANGRVHELLVVSKDITNVIEAEDRVQNLNEELLIRLEDIEKVNKELDQFVYSVSHDLRAPLASILGLINLTKNESELPVLKECLRRIGTSTEKLDDFIKDILDYSRNARTEIEATPFRIEELAKEILENIHLLRKPKTRVEILSKEETTYVGDRRRLSIILNNIISNSCKYADPAKLNSFVKVDINTNMEGCQIRIEDNGIGISDAVLDNVFNMFFRGTETSDGSGLGLYIVKECITRLKGTIELKAEEGVGTKIFLQIPHSNRKDPQKRSA